MENINPQLDYIRKFLTGSTIRPSRLAKMAGLHANTLRDFKSETWNPTTKTLNSLLALIAEHSRKNRRKPREATIPANQPQRKAV